MIEGKFFNVATEGDEIDEVVYNKAISGFVELSNKTDTTITISIVTNVPVVQFKEKRVILKPKESKKVEFTILYKLVETNLEGKVWFTTIVNSQRDELSLGVNLVCGK